MTPPRPRKALRQEPDLTFADVEYSDADHKRMPQQVRVIVIAGILVTMALATAVIVFVG